MTTNHEARNTFFRNYFTRHKIMQTKPLSTASSRQSLPVNWVPLRAGSVQSVTKAYTFTQTNRTAIVTVYFFVGLYVVHCAVEYSLSCKRQSRWVCII